MAPKNKGGAMVKTTNRMNCGDLLAGALPPEANDKVYLVCRVQEDAKGFRVEIDTTEPVCWLNDKYRAQFGHPDDPVVKEVQSGMNGLSLLSAGAFLWADHERMILLRRDEGAPSYAGALTEAAGRCGELPRQTMLKELNEELLVVCQADGEPKVLGLVNSAFGRHEVEQLKADQMTRRNYGRLDVHIAEAIPYTPSWLPESRVVVSIDGREADVIDGCSFYDAGNRTLEVRQSYLVPEQFFVISVHDGEPYDRAAVVAKPDEIAIHKELMVPSLQWALQCHIQAKQIAQTAPANSMSASTTPSL